MQRAPSSPALSRMGQNLDSLGLQHSYRMAASPESAVLASVFRDVNLLKTLGAPSMLDLRSRDRDALDREAGTNGGGRLSSQRLLYLSRHGSNRSVGGGVQPPPSIVSGVDSIPKLVHELAAMANWARTAGDPALHAFEVLTKLRFNAVGKAYLLLSQKVRLR